MKRCETGVMHIFFSGIGGTAIGPLAQIAQQAGYTVSGSDKQASQYIDYLKKHGIENIHIGQSAEHIAAVHERTPIDWFVYSSAVTMEQTDPPELVFCRNQGIKTSKRDELLNKILEEKQLKLIAIAGTHGKTTTTAMVIWLLKKLGIPVSYSVGAKISFGDMGQFVAGSEYFVLEADEFDRNFLAFHPFLSLITGVTWDHHEIFPTKDDYTGAFRQFIAQSQRTLIWHEDAERVGVSDSETVRVLQGDGEQNEVANIAGYYNRLDAWLAANGVGEIVGKKDDDIGGLLQDFPGLQRRMEQIVPNLYSDYAHTPEKIAGAMSVALEMSAKNNQELVVVYEPLTNRRQHYMKDDYKDCFTGAKRVYWLPSYAAREDPAQAVLSPAELITHLSDPTIAEARERDDSLKDTIQKHLIAGDMVVCMAGGGGNSLDEWLRQNFSL